MTHRFPTLRSQHQIDAISAPRPVPLAWTTFGACLMVSMALLLAAH